MNKVKAWIEPYKVYLTRTNMEIAAVVLMILSAFSVFTASFPSQGTLELDGKKMVYKGALVRGKMNGQGKLTFENGDSYQGQFRNGIFDGQGKFTSSKGWTYEGHFSKGLADGQGTLITQSKVEYKGNFKQGIYQHAN